MDKTIAAISTAYGEAGIGIVRMSGEDSLAILKKITGKSFDARRMVYCDIVDPENKKVLDEALAVYMPGPKSYTGEDVVEIQCHGSNIALKEILSLVIRLGAQPAERGEFTKRAFLNGRMDLSQAEAVIDLIKAKAGRSYKSAVNQLGGALSEKIVSIRKELLDLLVQITVNMDYPDEDIEEVSYKNMFDALSGVREKLEDLKSTSSEGRIVREGLSVAIVGKPNVGKSSLMNVFLQENRSIVTDVPGTTRDTIEESAALGGIEIKFTDTAGIHESSDVVEALGIERSKDAFNRADLLLVVLDESTKLSDEDKEILDMSKGRARLIVHNKVDLVNNNNVNDKENIFVSIKNNFGIDELKKAIEDFVLGGKVRRDDDVLLCNVRHINLVDKALAEINEAINMTSRKEAIDFIEVNTKAAFDYLGEIIGETATDQVIEEVFSRFCLGK